MVVHVNTKRKICHCNSLMSLPPGQGPVTHLEVCLGQERLQLQMEAPGETDTDTRSLWVVQQANTSQPGWSMPAAHSASNVKHEQLYDITQLSFQQAPFTLLEQRIPGPADLHCPEQLSAITWRFISTHEVLYTVVCFIWADYFTDLFPFSSTRVTQ